MSRTVPAEWAAHRAMWVGFPSHADLWQDDLAAAQSEVAALARALAGPGAERVRLLVSGDEAEAAARTLTEGAGVEIVRGQFGDVWLRDTGPIFARDGDDLVAEQLAAAAGAPRIDHDFVLEGGALDGDGFGTVLTTRQCLLNPNRNPGWDQARAEAALRDALGAKTVLWLGDGLRNDHTDGHIDNLARFVAPGVVACPMAMGRDDPNAGVYDDAARLLQSFRDARGSALQVRRIPSPGRIADEDFKALPASHMNFVIANQAVIAPVYGEKGKALMLEALKALFPERIVIGLPSNALLTGGGSFHCITQQEPA